MTDSGTNPPHEAIPREQHAGNGEGSGVDESFAEDDATVLATTAALSAEDFPVGLTPQELSHALQGEMLDHFHLQQFLGGGGMGVVFKALDTTLNRIVAVKVVASRSVTSEELQRRFLVEAQSAARLDHPNIARVHFVGRDRGLPYIVMEYVDGSNVRDMVASRGRLPLSDALNYAYQIAHALCHAWQRGVVHRDIKPSNILITHDGQAKLVDMGLARFRHVDTHEDDLTNTGITLGTFDYISPEQARDPRTADTRSDIYSLGCTLYYMLAAHPPFSGGNPVQKLLQHQGETPPSLRLIRSDIPESITRLVDRMLSKSPADRPQTPHALLAELADFMIQQGMMLPQSLAQFPVELPQPAPPGFWRRHLPWVLPLATLVALWAGLHFVDGTASVTSNQFPPLQTNQDEQSVDVSSEAIGEEPVGNNTVEAKPSELTNSQGNITAEQDVTSADISDHKRNAGESRTADGGGAAGDDSSTLSEEANSPVPPLP